MFEADIAVSLEESAETLEYISGLLESQENSNNVVLFTNLIIRKEIFSSIRDGNVNDIECQRVLALLKKISTNNPDLDVSNYINEMLNNISNDGKVNFEMKKDGKLSDIAITTMLNRNINSMEEFELLLQDLPKVLIDKEKYDWNLSWGFMCFFEKQFERQSELDFILMLEKTLETVSKENCEDIMLGFWEKMPEDMKKNQLKNFVDICSKHKKIDLEFAHTIMSQMDPENIKENLTLADETFGEHIPNEIIPFLKIPRNKEELEEIIAEAKSRGANFSTIQSGISTTIRTEIRKENPNIKEMLYTQLEFLGNRFNRSHAVAVFFIYANKTQIQENAEEILRHALIDKNYFEEDDILLIIEAAKKHSKSKGVEEDSDLIFGIDKIQEEAIERTKQIKTEVISLGSKKEISIEDVSDSERKEMLALQEIRDNVPANEISTGKRMIQQFLNKAKEMKNKIGKFFGGGDDHENR